MAEDPGARRAGVGAGIAAYALWGVLPLYWKLLDAVPVGELLGHRIVWSFVALAAWALLTGRVPGLLRALDRRVLATTTAASLLVGTNWLLYVWAVTAERVVEVSLGYFMNPMVSVVLGVVVLGERLDRWQQLGVAIAALGVGILLVGSGGLPWVSLTLALSFGGYGLIKKLAPLGAVDGLLVETTILVVPSAVVLGAAAVTGTGALGRDIGFDLLLVGSGVATSLPLLLFGVAARRVPLAVLGVLQYLAPTLQLLLAVAVFGEAFGGTRAVAFGCVWLGILVFVARPQRSAAH